jgi:PIN domain nuclease of toxin-antitoxin system
VKLLLDTHILVWWLTDSRQLNKRARALIAGRENVVFVSAASVWELRIKEGLGKVTLPVDFGALLRAQPFEALAITFTHADAVRELPLHHRDPFDRLLIAQARSDVLTLLTHDQMVTQYDVGHILV